jgi:biopolymer transport protein ExbB
VNARLWILDTVVTAAPLLGLLGTILGIMDTFSALSSGGISDPAAVSRGIAAALLATAIGIGTALYGLLGHNILHRYSDYLTDEFKGFILACHGLETGVETEDEEGAGAAAATSAAE